MQVNKNMLQFVYGSGILQEIGELKGSEFFDLPMFVISTLTTYTRNRMSKEFISSSLKKQLERLQWFDVSSLSSKDKNVVLNVFKCTRFYREGNRVFFEVCRFADSVKFTGLNFALDGVTCCSFDFEFNAYGRVALKAFSSACSVRNSTFVLKIFDGFNFWDIAYTQRGVYLRNKNVCYNITSLKGSSWCSWNEVLQF